MCSRIETPLDTATGIAVEDLFALHASEHLLIGTLYAAAPHEVASHDRAISLEVIGTCLREVAQQMGSMMIVVLTDGAGAYREAWELIQLLLKASYFLGLELGEEDLGGIGIVAPIDSSVTDGFELLDDLLTGKAQRRGE